jgi:hypothetical protein
MAVISSRNTQLTTILKDQSLAVDFMTPLIDFKEMNSGFIQAVVTTNPTLFTGEFEIKVSLLCDEATMVPYPNSKRVLNSECNNFGWEFCCLAFRYAQICYTANTTADGVVDLYARAKRS